MKTLSRIINISIICTLITLNSCTNPEKLKIIIKVGHYMNVVDEIQLKFDGIKDTVSDSLIFKVKNIDKMLADSVDYYNRFIEASLESGKFNTSDKNEIISKLNEVKLKVNGLKQQVINKKVEGVIKSLEIQKLKLNEDLNQTKKFALVIRKAIEKSINDQIYIIDSTVNDLKIQLKKMIDDLKREAEGIPSPTSGE